MKQNLERPFEGEERRGEAGCGRRSLPVRVGAYQSQIISLLPNAKSVLSRWEVVALLAGNALDGEALAVRNEQRERKL